MGIENFIKDALHEPNDYIAYHVGRELAELHPDKAIIEGNTGYFDLDAFVRAEKCSMVEESSVFITSDKLASRPKRPAGIPARLVAPRAGRGHLLDVVLITWRRTATAHDTIGSFAVTKKLQKLSS